MGDPKWKQRTEYVKWSDVLEWSRYLEQGYGVKLTSRLWQDCPKGEQYPKLYVRLTVHQAEGGELEGFQHLMGRFPTAEHKSLPALILKLLWQFDHAAAEKLLWSEPLAAKPERLA